MKKTFYFLFLSVITLSISAQNYTYEDMINRAMDYVEKKDYAAAEQAMKAALRKEPTNPNNLMLLVNLGTIQRNLGKLDEALISYNVAIERYPENTFIRHNRAALFCEMNRFDEALIDYNTILIATPDDVEALYRRGLIYLSNKNLFAAEEDFEKIVEISPENLNGKMGLASIMKRRGEWKEAEEVYTDLIYKHKTKGDLYFHRAECYLRLNKLASMQDDLKKAVDFGYNEAPFYVLRGQLRLAQYEKRLAKDDFLKARKLGTDSLAIENFLKLCK